MGCVVLVASQKSDIGKTVLSIKMGIELSQKGKKVLLADLSNGKRKMAEYLNVNEDIIYDIKDVLDGTCSLEQAVIDVVENLSIVPYPRIQGKFKDTKREDFKRLINEAKNIFDYVILDTDKLSSSFIDFEFADYGVIVNNNDFSCIRELNTDKDITFMYGLKNIAAVINRYNKKNAVKGTMLKLKDIQKMIDMQTLDNIEENAKYLNMDRYFLFNNEDNSFTKTVKNIISKF